jgi:uncharacterized protein YlzI (FlbEa/FlbD family)
MTHFIEVDAITYEGVNTGKELINVSHIITVQPSDYGTVMEISGRKTVIAKEKYNVIIDRIGHVGRVIRE